MFFSHQPTGNRFSELTFSQTSYVSLYPSKWSLSLAPRISTTDTTQIMLGVWGSTASSFIPLANWCGLGKGLALKKVTGAALELLHSRYFCQLKPLVSCQG